MKRNKIIFWIATGIIALFEGVMPALTSQTELAKEGLNHLGYPEYFGPALVVFKILGVLADHPTKSSPSCQRMGLCRICF